MIQGTMICFKVRSYSVSLSFEKTLLGGGCYSSSGSPDDYPDTDQRNVRRVIFAIFAAQF